MQKTWAALYRRSETELPVQVCFDNVFSSLRDRSLGTGVSIPETVIFGHMEHKHFRFDQATATVVCTPSSLTTARGIVEAFLSDVPVDAERGHIVAVWYCERKDAKGTLVAAEYFTAAQLVSFFECGERRKLGVLQRFIYPRPRKGAQTVNNEIVVHWNANGEVEVQRLYASVSNRLDAPDLAPTLRALVHPPVLVSGKVAAMTLPIAPSDVAGPHAEVIEVATFVQHVGGLCGRLQSSIEAASDGRHQVRTFTALMKFSRDDDQLYFCGLLALRLSFGPSFELVRVSHASQEKPHVESSTSGEFDVVPLSHTNAHGYAAYIPAAARLQRSPTRGGGSPDGDGGSGDEGSVSYLFPKGPPGHFECPNCGVVAPKADFGRVPYRTIVAHTNRRSAAARRDLESVLPRPKQETWVYRPSSAKPQKQRPQSARIAASAEAARQIPDDAPCFKLGHEWTDVPPVLRRLKLPLDEVATRPAWMSRSATLCNGCVQYFTSGAVSGETEAAGSAAILTTSDQEAERAAALKQRSRKRSPPGFLQSDVIDGMVLTDLQRAHRAQRRAERAKFEMREVIEAARKGEGAVGRAEREEREIADLLGRLEDAQNAPLLGPGSDTPPSLVLANELYAALQAQLNVPHSLVLRPSVVPGAAYQRPLPPPPVLLDVSFAGKRSGDAQGTGSKSTSRRIAHRALAGGSTTFSDLDAAERRLLVEIVGQDTTRVVDDETDPYESEA